MSVYYSNNSADEPANQRREADTTVRPDEDEYNGSMTTHLFETERNCRLLEQICKVRSSLALFSYFYVRVQSNPYVLEETGVY